MKKFIVSVMLLLSVTSFGQVNIDRYHTQDSIYSKEVVDGECKWKVDTNSIYFSQYTEDGDFIINSGITVSILEFRETSLTKDYTVKIDDMVFTVSFFKKEKIVAYTYLDESFILMYGDIHY